MDLIQLVYISSLSDGSGKALPDILRTAVQFNEEHGITGMLLCVDGVLIQALEGEQSVVERLFGKIRKDVRHHGVVVLTTHHVSSRQFDGWSMGFREIGHKELADIPKYASVFGFTKGEVASRVRAGLAADLLSDFGNDGRH
jgi:hypothetical protein